ncbi:hypothetical protein AruPA_21415 [Acidiphilium sp. PA]|uniref:hypothetical protein n=1 Tax=Acidiphilium sp. PA TaxID=2871705 RepID=UPI002243B73F|nr:hypothetical protein [Acidiphilium sp. PA]MCW8309569.1 hypothetical protein [Acidiphilium sp. PA]
MPIGFNALHCNWNIQCLRHSHDSFKNRLTVVLVANSLSWSQLIGRFGGWFKLFSGCIHAASLVFSIAGASPGNAEFSIL